MTRPTPSLLRRALAPSASWWWAPVALVVLGVAAYSNSFRVPFHFDDVAAILRNPTLRRLGDAWNPPAEWGVTVAGRPILNVSLAVNYAISGANPGSYHVGNLLIHLTAGLVLYGFVRRALLCPGVPPKLAALAQPIAGVTALLWTLHPLQTESVTYVVQRAESLMGLFFLFTFYAVVRSLTSARRHAWEAVAVVSCALGAGTKEVIATAPLLVLLFDRAFVVGRFSEAWRRRRGLYVGLAATWLIIGFLVASAGGDRGGTFSLTRQSAMTYWASQTEAVVHYVRLSLWPHPLVFEYGLPHTPEGWRLPVYAVLVAAGVLTVAVALWKAPRAGFVGAWFFGILAPTSIVPGMLQAIVEHRMYLSLAAVVVAIVCAAAWRGGVRGVLALSVFGVVGAGMTFQRNTVYRDDLMLWTDTVARSPRSAIAHANVGLALLNRGRLEDAISHYRAALAIDPTQPNFHYNLGQSYAAAGKREEAVAEFTTAARLNPQHYTAHYKAGEVLRALGRSAEAEEQFQFALKEKPDLGSAYQQIGFIASEAGDWNKAAAAFEQAWKSDATLVAALGNLGAAEFSLGKLPEAERHLEAAIAAAPDLAAAHFALGQVRLAQADLGKARHEFEEAARLDPSQVDAQLNLGLLFAQQGEIDAALPHFETAVRLAPKRADAHANLGNALVERDRVAEALKEYETALALDPASATTHVNAANALLRLQRYPEALQQFETAVKLDPRQTAAADMAKQLRAHLSRPVFNDAYLPR